MQRFHSVMAATVRRCWLLGALSAVVVLGGWGVVRPQAPPQAQTARVLPVPQPTLTWTYAAAAPERFVVRRSLDGGTWQDVAVVPGKSGTDISWQDTTLPASPLPFVAAYVVYVVQNTVWSETSNRVIRTFGGAPRLPPAQVKIVRADSEETQAANNAAILAGDADPVTMWHTQWGATSAPLPHWIVLDLGAVLPVDGLAYLPRQDSETNGRIAQFEVAVSQDDTAWSEPVAKGTWLWGPNALEQYVRWKAVEARYVRLKAFTEVSGAPWTSAAEIGLYAGRAEPGPGPAPGECVMAMPEPTLVITTCRLP